MQTPATTLTLILLLSSLAGQPSLAPEVEPSPDLNFCLTLSAVWCWKDGDRSDDEDHSRTPAIQVFATPGIAGWGRADADGAASRGAAGYEWGELEYLPPNTEWRFQGVAASGGFGQHLRVDTSVELSMNNTHPDAWAGGEAAGALYFHDTCRRKPVQASSGIEAHSSQIGVGNIEFNIFGTGLGIPMLHRTGLGSFRGLPGNQPIRHRSRVTNLYEYVFLGGVVIKAAAEKSNTRCLSELTSSNRICVLLTERRK